MRQMRDRNTVLLISTYPPKACGIASYSQDLTNALTARFGDSFSVKICALESGRPQTEYSQDVIATLDTTRKKNYIRLAQQVNTDESIQSVWIQHEFGLFSGQYGRYLLYFLHEISKPVIITFHTVLPNPDKALRRIVEAIVDAAQVVTVMTAHSQGLLVSQYNIDPSKVHIIPHGTHVVRWKNKDRVKEHYGLGSKLILSTFGLLGPNKSIETALHAMPAIVAECPDVLYFVLGRTHPNEVLHNGEAYRNSLLEIVEKLNLQDHVRFVNEYLELDELLQLLQVTDVYLFTSKDPNQAVSGTFQYAMSCGCAVVSTRMPHAVEMLQDGSGLLIDFNNTQQLAEAAIRLLKDRQLRENSRQRAFERTRATSWNNVALAHAKLISRVMDQGKLSFNLPPVSLDHLFRLTDHLGIIQFAKISEPDPYSGYTLDDNARALIAACMYQMYDPSDKVEELIRIYLDFIKDRQLKDGSFLNYVDWKGMNSHLNHYVNLEDSNGRTIWALGYLCTLQDILPAGFGQLAGDILYRSLKYISTMSSPRAMSFSLKGLYFFHTVKGGESISKLVTRLADRLLHYYEHSSDNEWKWYERYLTYANAVIPEAMLYAFLLTGKKEYRKIARESFDFLRAKIFQKHRIQVISNRGWLNHGAAPTDFGEQPIDVAYTIIALDLFWKVFKHPAYRKNMDIAFEWFLGRNHLNQMIYNPASGGCYDGLEDSNVNLNQGAESLVCYLIARLHMEFIRQDEMQVQEEGYISTEADAKEMGVINY